MHIVKACILSNPHKFQLAQTCFLAISFSLNTDLYSFSFYQKYRYSKPICAGGVLFYIKSIPLNEDQYKSIEVTFREHVHSVSSPFISHLISSDVVTKASFYMEIQILYGNDGSFQLILYFTAGHNVTKAIT